MKKFLLTSIAVSMLLVGCDNEKVEKTEEEVNNDNINVEEVEDSITNEQDILLSWKEEIESLVSNSDDASGKYYDLEKYLLKYQPSEEDIEQFSKDIVADYKSGTYLNEIDNHERMLTNILKSYYVQKYSEGSLSSFALDYHQNLIYTYRGVDAVDSDSVKSNEDQINKVIDDIK